MEEKNQKKFLVIKIIASESGTTNSHNRENDYWYLWWKNLMKVPSCRFSKSLGPFYMLTLKGHSEAVFYESFLMQILQEFGSL